MFHLLLSKVYLPFQYLPVNSSKFSNKAICQSQQNVPLPMMIGVFLVTIMNKAMTSISFWLNINNNQCHNKKGNGRSLKKKKQDRKV